MKKYLITVGGKQVIRLLATDQMDAVARFVEGRDIPAGLDTIRAYEVVALPTRKPRR